MTNRESCRRYRKSHREEICARKRARYAASDEVRKKGVSYYRANEKRIYEYQRTWAAANREKTRAHTRKWSRGHPQQSAKMARDWRRNNRERVAFRERQYRARRRSVGGSFTSAEWNLVLALFGFRCAYCWENGLKLDVDHVVPSSKGGSSFIENLLPACRPCNSRKGNRVYPRNRKEQLNWPPSC